MRAFGRAALIVALFVVIAVVQQPLMDRTRPSGRDSLLYLPNSAVVEVMSCGFGPAAAALLRVRAINYVMEELGSSPNPLYLKRTFDTLVELDPHAVPNYNLGFLFLTTCAQRHAAGLDLMAKADGRFYDVKLDGRVVRSSRVATGKPARWLDFRGRYLRPPAKKGRVSLDHPSRFRLNIDRASYFLSMKRNLELAGQEFLAGAEQRRTPGPLKIQLRAGGQGLIRRAGRDPLVPRLLSQRKAFEDRVAKTENPVLKTAAQARVDEITTRLAELAYEKELQSFERAGVTIRSFAELKSRSTQNVVDAYGEGFVLLSGGRVRSPARVVAATRRQITDRLRNFAEEHGGAAPKSLAEVGIQADEIPAELTVTYDPESGLTVSWSGPAASSGG